MYISCCSAIRTFLPCCAWRRAICSNIEQTTSFKISTAKMLECSNWSTLWTSWPKVNVHFRDEVFGSFLHVWFPAYFCRSFLGEQFETGIETGRVSVEMFHLVVESLSRRVEIVVRFSDVLGQSVICFKIGVVVFNVEVVRAIFCQFVPLAIYRFWLDEVDWGSKVLSINLGLTFSPVFNVVLVFRQLFDKFLDNSSTLIRNNQISMV